MIYIDANYWIYYLDSRLPEHKYVIEPMRKAIHEGIVMNLVTLVEITHYLRHLPEKELIRKIRTIQNLATLRLIELDTKLFDVALKKLIKYVHAGIGGRDSVILATMEITDTKRIATHDEAFKRVKEIEVVDTIKRHM